MRADMEFLSKVATFLQDLTKKQFQQYLALFIGGTCLVLGGISYWVYQQSDTLIVEIKKIETLSNKAIKILAEYERLQQDARRVQDLFDQNKDFTIQSFFETFCKEQGITPERGWSARTEETNERFDETVLAAIFKGLATEKIVKILVALDKNNIVYIKELSLKNEGNKKITLEITIATKKIKKGFEQKGL